MKTETNGAAALTTSMNGQPRALTPDERGKVRDLLDLNFDAEAGRFISGYSDDRIAKEVNVPRKAVEVMRETAYGELKVSPEMAKAMDDAAALKKTGQGLLADLANLQGQARGLADKVKTFNERAAAVLARIEGRVN